MRPVAEDTLGLGLPAVLPKGTQVPIRHVANRPDLPESYELKEDAHLCENETDCRYTYRSADFELPSDMIRWELLPQYDVMKPHGGPFHRSASDQMTRALHENDGSILDLAMYRLHFVRHL